MTQYRFRINGKFVSQEEFLKIAEKDLEHINRRANLLENMINKILKEQGENE